MTAEIEIADTDECAVNPCCDQQVEGRDCSGDAGHAGDCTPWPFSRDEKIDYLFTQAKALETLVTQAGPLLDQAGPMLESLAPVLSGLGGKASSPMGRIFGSLL